MWNAVAPFNFFPAAHLACLEGVDFVGFKRLREVKLVIEMYKYYVIIRKS